MGLILGTAILPQSTQVSIQEMNEQKSSTVKNK